jgi:hypothetical protein
MYTVFLLYGIPKMALRRTLIGNGPKSSGLNFTGGVSLFLLSRVISLSSFKRSCRLVFARRLSCVIGDASRPPSRSLTPKDRKTLSPARPLPLTYTPLRSTSPTFVSLFATRVSPSSQPWIAQCLTQSAQAVTGRRRRVASCPRTTCLSALTHTLCLACPIFASNAL